MVPPAAGIMPMITPMIADLMKTAHILSMSLIFISSMDTLESVIRVLSW